MIGWAAARWIATTIPDSAANTPLTNDNDPALRYAVAVQEGHCEQVMEMTRWIRERIAYVKATETDPAAVEQTREEICADMQERPVEQNVITPEGIEDKFAFPPGASIEVVRRDQGHPGLDEPLSHRTWLRVRYPVERYAPRDQLGRIVQSMVVGVNVSEQGMIVKAGVRGNIEVDESAIEVAAASAPGE